MQQSYILANKENDYSGQRPSYRLKMNYQQRQKTYERSKSPLGENNQRFNFGESKDIFKAPLSSKRRDFSYKYADESTSISPFGQKYDQNVPTSYINRQSATDLSKIKPISLENRKNQQLLANITIDKEPLDEKHAQNDYRSTYSKSAHRQNSKHLGFIAKVDNLQKINHQISNLLSYVYENKSSKKENDLGEYSASKPRYGLISQNSKSYQRRLNALQKPKVPQPNISVFDAENIQRRLTPSNKQTNKSLIYKDLSNKSLQKVDKNDIATRQNKSRTPRSAIKVDFSPRNIQKPKTLQNNFTLSPMKAVKSQQFQPLLTPSQSLQKMSKITTGNNPDLEFYYQSLKKRDQEIQKFRKDNKDENAKYFQKKGKKVEQKNQSALKEKQYQKQRNAFVTEQQIQVYKDMSRLKKIQNQRVPSTKRIQNLRAEINRSENERISSQQKFFLNRKQRNLSPNDALKKKTPQQEDVLNLRPQRLKIQPDFCAKIQDQMTKIQNQLKECQNQKSLLRGKYSNLLVKEKSAMIDKKIQPTNTIIVENIPSKKQDNERMFDSSTKKVYKRCAELKTENDDEFHRDLRKRIISQNQPLGNNQSFKNQFSMLDEKSFDQRNFSSKKNPQLPQNNRKDRSFAGRFGQNFDLAKGYEADMSSIERSSQLKELKTPHGRTQKKFEIMLQKVEITKPQTTKLGSLLSQKIQLDMKLRQQREKFWKNKNPNKWQDLRQHLVSRYGMSKSTRQLQELLSISSEEHNPFSPTQMSQTGLKNFNQQINQQRDGFSEQDILLLASLLSESLNYFDSQLLHNFSEEKLKKEHFQFRQLDLSSKGYLSLEDLICFINLHSGKFYRNRDVIFLIKSMMLFHKDLIETNLSGKDGIQSYNSEKGGNAYKISYNFLWRIFTDKK